MLEIHNRSHLSDQKVFGGEESRARNLFGSKDCLDIIKFYLINKCIRRNNTFRIKRALI
jgi:hypothetical protein